ncbi:hypothetical protein WAI453_012422 [Rhynchosporium graminicola]
MVTSRSQSRASRGGEAVETTHVQVSSGKKRRLRSSIGGEEDEAEVAKQTLTPAKKRKTLPVREKDSSPLVKKSVLMVEIPAKKNTPVREPEPVVGTTAKPIEIEDDVEEGGDAEVSEEGEREEEVEEPKEVELDTKKIHKRFDSEEVKPAVFLTAQEVPESVGEAADSEEGSDSEDDAPEAIGTKDAAKEILTKERDTAKAVKEQMTASRKKRKERDEVLRKQSEKAKKRKPVFIAAESDEEAEQSKQSVIDTFPSHILSSRSALPEFLPAEYLEDTDPQDTIRTEDAEPAKKKGKKTRFIDADLKAPKDRRVGKTTYRVAKAGSTNLAPKASFRARSTKDAWMQGRSGGMIDPNRRAFAKAFGRR